MTDGEINQQGIVLNVLRVLREAAVRHLGEARAALAKLDVRVPNLESALPALVAQYRQARTIVDAGRGAKAAAVVAENRLLG